MGTVFHDAALVHDQDHVRVLHGSQAVGDHEDGPALPHLPDGIQDVFFGEGVQSAGGFVKDQDTGVHQHGPADGDLLPLSAGKGVAPFADDGFVTGLHLHDEVMGAAHAGCLLDFFIGGAGAGDGDVIPHRAAEQVILLQHRADLAAVGGRVVFADVDVVYKNTSFFQVVHALQQFYQGALAAAGRAHDAHHDAGGQFHVDVLDHLGLVVAVTEADLFKEDLALPDGRHFAPAVAFLGQVHDVADTVDGDTGLLELLPYAYEAQHGTRNLAGQHLERYQLAYRQLPGHDQMGANP